MPIDSPAPRWRASTISASRPCHGLSPSIGRSDHNSERDNLALSNSLQMALLLLLTIRHDARSGGSSDAAAAQRIRPADAWTVQEQNRLLSVCFGLPEVTRDRKEGRFSSIVRPSQSLRPARTEYTDHMISRPIVLFECLGRWLVPVCVVLLAVLSLMPAEELVRTSLPGRFEHFFAYLATGAVAAVGYGRARSIRVAILLSAYAGLLELGQIWAPGRHSQLSDFAASAAGAIAGAAFMHYCWPASRR
jgi:VanZ family protein